MIFECCTRQKMRYEIERYLEDLDNSKEINVKIRRCKVLEGTFDLEITEMPSKAKEEGK